MHRTALQQPGEPTCIACVIDSRQEEESEGSFPLVDHGVVLLAGYIYKSITCKNGCLNKSLCVGNTTECCVHAQKTLVYN